MLRIFLLTGLFFAVLETSAQKKRLWLATIVTVHGPTRHIGLMHSMNDSLISILPGFTRKKLQAAIELNQPFQIPIKAIKKVKIRKVRTVLGSTWEFSRFYLPLFIGSFLLFQPEEPAEVLAINAGSAAAAVVLQNAISVRTFKPTDPSFKYAIQKYCYYPSFRVPVEGKQKK